MESKYMPEGAIGLRFKKVIFSTEDINHIQQPSLIEEAYIRRKQYLQNFIYQYNYIEMFNVSTDYPNPQSSAYLSSIYYRPKQDYQFDMTNNQPDKKQDFVQQNNINSDKDLLTNKQKNQNLQQFQQQFAQNLNQFQHDNAYIAFASNTKQIHEIKSEYISKDEELKIFESLIQKKSETQIEENLIRLNEIFNNQLPSIEKLNTLSFTFDNQTDYKYYLQDITPQIIQDLSPSSPNYQFFHNILSINPQISVDFEEDIQILIPKMKYMKIKNQHQSESIIIYEILSQSPEITFYQNASIQLPLVLKPHQELEIIVILSPETIGSFHIPIYIILNQYKKPQSLPLLLFMTVKAQIIPNKYELFPLYYDDVLFNDQKNMNQIEIPLYIYNYQQDRQLIIQEIYTSADYLKLKWPNNIDIDRKIDYYQDMDENVSKYLEIEPQEKKHFITLQFNGTDVYDYAGFIQMLTIFGDII